MDITVAGDPHRNTRPERRRVEMKVIVSDANIEHDGDRERVKLTERWMRWCDGLEVFDVMSRVIRDDLRYHTQIVITGELRPPVVVPTGSMQIVGSISDFSASITYASQAIGQISQTIGQNLGGTISTSAAQAASDINRIAKNFEYRDFKYRENG